MDKYILNKDNITIKCNDLRKWGQWFENNKNLRCVALHQLNNLKVSTVFLGIDHNWSEKGPPLLFETMIFGGVYNQTCQRYSTYIEALKGHKIAAKKVGFKIKG